MQLDKGGDDGWIKTDYIIKDGEETLVIDIAKLSPKESIAFIKVLKEEFDVKHIKEPGNGV